MNIFENCGKNDRRVFFILLGVMCLGVIMRLYNLSSRPLWFDELSTISIAEKSLRFILHPFSYYKFAFIILLKVWMKIFGVNTIGVRILPALFGAASIFFTYKIGKDLFSARVGLIASFLLSTSCFHIYQSQQVVQYTFLLFVVLVSLFCLVRFMIQQKTKFIIWNALLNIVILNTHPFGFSIILVQAFFMIIHGRAIVRAALKTWLLSQALLFIAFSVWLVNMYAGERYLKAILWWERLPSLVSLIDTFKTFCYGLHYGLIDIQLQPLPFVEETVCVIFGVFFVQGLYYISLKYYSQIRSHLIIFWLFVPIGLTLIFSYLFRSVYVIKHFLIVLPAFYYIVAIGLSHKTRSFVVVIILLIIFGLNTFPLRVMYKTNAHVDWHKVVQIMKGHSLREDAIIIMATTKEVVCLAHYLSDGDKNALQQIDIFGKLTDSGWQDSFQFKEHYIVTLGNELYHDRGAYYDPGIGPSMTYTSEYIIADFHRKILQNNILSTNKQIWLLVSRWAGDEYRRRSIVQELKIHLKMGYSNEDSGIMVYRFDPV